VLVIEEKKVEAEPEAEADAEVEAWWRPPLPRTSTRPWPESSPRLRPRRPSPTAAAVAAEPEEQTEA
jgi:hypothetical protein